MCGKNETNALTQNQFLLDKEEKKIICYECASNNNIKTKDVPW